MKRRELLVGALGAAAFGAARRAEGQRMGKFWVFVGTNTTNGRSKGIYRFEWDTEAGKAGDPVLAAESANPTFVAIHPTGRYLYGVNAIADFGGGKTGALSAFSLDRKTGALSLLNQQPSSGPGPCHVITDRAGKHALVANYVGGSVSVIPIGEDGKLAAPTCAIQHAGSGPDPKRQEGPHAHSINLDAAERFAYVADLGLDRVFVYRFDSAAGKLTPADPPFASTPPVSGPRHFSFHPSGGFAYVINELASTITAFRCEPASGALTVIQTVPTLPEGFKGENYTSEILVHRSGRFLFGSNRGHDSLARFLIDPDSGRLSAAGHESTHGGWPRNFAFDPSGRWMVVGNQNTDNIRFYRVDPDNGALTWTGQEIKSPVPICFRMVARHE